MENELMKWIQDFPSLIENSKDYKNLLKRFTEWQLKFGNQISGRD